MAEIGYPCFVKPVMSSSGKGQSVVRCDDDVAPAWQYARRCPRRRRQRHRRGRGSLRFRDNPADRTGQRRDPLCAPIGHRQQEGDYRESWQPQAMSPTALARAQAIAASVVRALGDMVYLG
ncbi:ATP-grasp domain-containing protein [Edwardsiella anguillarum]|nr:ATP-grasp domain-containing protein [Edwardsiella anguillarum]